MFHFLFNDCFNILTFRYPNVNIIFNKTTKSSHLLFQRETKKADYTMQPASSNLSENKI